ncbi:MAG: SDR family oxidoreductase [Anaerolineae bacterium]
MIDPRLQGKVALITGANNPRGIGAAVARALAAQGTAVFLTYKRGTPVDPPASAEEAKGGAHTYAYHSSLSAESIVESIHASGGRAAAAELDLTDPAAIAPLFDHIEAALGSVDIVINNAAHSTADTFLPSANTLVNTHSVEWLGGSVPTLTAASHDAHFAINARTPALIMVEFARRHVNRGASWGRIVNLSTDGSPAFPSEIAYGASKHALESYTRAAAVELGQFGITINAVSPGPTQTGWMTPHMQADAAGVTPLRRIGYAEDIADVIVFLCSEQARWITGQVIHVNGGHRV